MVDKKIKKKNGRKRVSKTPTARKQKPRKDWEKNNMNISDAFFDLATKKQRVPSYREIAEHCGVAEKTVQRHLETVEFSDIKQKFRACSDKVLLKLMAKALQMSNHQYVRLYFEVVEDLGMKKKVDFTSGGKEITLTVDVIGNETKKELDKLK